MEKGGGMEEEEGWIRGVVCRETAPGSDYGY